MKGNIKKSMVLIVFRGQRLFSSKTGHKAEMSTLTSLVQHCNGNPSQCSKARKRKANQIRKEEINLALHTNGMIVYIQNPKDSARKLPELGKWV